MRRFSSWARKLRSTTEHTKLPKACWIDLAISGLLTLRQSAFHTDIITYILTTEHRITEHGFAGLGVGAALAGLNPVVEFMTWNFAVS